MSETAAERTMLFADLVGSVALYERLGDAVAQRLVQTAVNGLIQAVKAGCGEVIKTIGDEVMSVFASPADAATTAINMQRTAGTAMALRIGFHHGPVIRTATDAFGDSVNLAARLTAAARGGQILFSETAVARLPRRIMESARLYDVDKFKGKDQPIKVYELLWDSSPEVTQIGARSSQFTDGDQPYRKIRLTVGSIHTDVQGDFPGLWLGRDAGCGVRVNAPLASRMHSRLEYRRGKFVLTDHSTNGSFITDHLGREVFLRRESMPLTSRGIISLGCPLKEQSGEAVRFTAE